MFPSPFTCSKNLCLKKLSCIGVALELIGDDFFGYRSPMSTSQSAYCTTGCAQYNCVKEGGLRFKYFEDQLHRERCELVHASRWNLSSVREWRGREGKHQVALRLYMLTTQCGAAASTRRSVVHAEH
jgi:hypothetical protein